MKIVTKRPDGTIRVQTVCSQEHPKTKNNPEYENKTQQQFKDEVDINNIVKKFKAGQSVPLRHPGYFTDFNQATGLMEAQEQINAAAEAFLEIPATLREKFGNDPLKFLEFVQNPKNKETITEFGLTNYAPAETTLKDIHTALTELKRDDSNDANKTKENAKQ